MCHIKSNKLVHCTNSVSNMLQQLLHTCILNQLCDMCHVNCNFFETCGTSNLTNLCTVPTLYLTCYNSYILVLNQLCDMCHISCNILVCHIYSASHITLTLTYSYCILYQLCYVHQLYARMLHQIYNMCHINLRIRMLYQM